MGEGTSIDIAAIDIGTLPTMGRDGLRDLWRKLHRKPPPRGLTGELLVRALAWRIQCERHGGLSRGLEQRLARVAREVMRNAMRDEHCPVGAPETGEGADGSMASGRSASSSSPSPSVRRTLRPGTRLVRAWQGQVHEVTVLPQGFLWNGKTHRSLSVIARAITGTSWNGWLFFGVNRKPEKITSLNSPSSPSSGRSTRGASSRLPARAVEHEGKEHITP